jgi:single-strand DNA-binding protein
MAYGLNKVQLIGHLGSAPELTYTDSQVAKVKFRMATNESYKDQSGTLVKKTEWHNIIAWRRLAEVMGEFLKSGSQVYIEGKLQTRDWEDKDGNKHYMTEIVASEFMFLDSKGGGQQGGSGTQGGGYAQSPEGPSTGDAAQAPATKSDEDDLPF